MKKLIERIVKFGLSGLINNLVFYVFYYLILFINKDIYMFANVVAFLISTFSAYLLNSKVVFKDKEKETKQTIVKTYVTYTISLIVSSVCLWICVEKLGFSEAISPFLSLFVTVPMNFLINYFWVY